MCDVELLGAWSHHIIDNFNRDFPLERSVLSISRGDRMVKPNLSPDSKMDSPLLNDSHQKTIRDCSDHSVI